MRNLNNHDKASLHLTEVLELKAGDIITISTEQSANNGRVTMRSAGTSTLYVEKKR